MNIILFNYDVNFPGHMDQDFEEQELDIRVNDGWYFSQKPHWEKN